MKNLLTIFFLIFSLSSFAQKSFSNYYASLLKADSLGRYNYFTSADSIYDNVLSNGAAIINFPPRLKFKTLYSKANLYERQERNDEALNLLLQIKSNPDFSKFKEVSYLSNLSIALIYEKNDDFKKCKTYLDEAKQILQINKLDSLAADYYVRLASYFRLERSSDSAIYYAELAYDFSKKYNRNESFSNANFLLGMLLTDSLPEKAIYHYKNSKRYFKSHSDSVASAAMCNNIAKVFMRQNNLDSAFYYNNLAIKGLKGNAPSFYFGTKSMILELNGELDSALFYANKASMVMHHEFSESKSAAIAEITEKYQNDSYKQTIEEQRLIVKKQVVAFVVSVSLIIVFFLLVIRLIIANKKFKGEKKFAEEQTEKLTQSLNKQEILFSELHHRVKNNLQIVSNILELQTEQTNDSQVVKITSESQNRLKAMALIHETLYSTNNFKKIDFQEYLDKLMNSLAVFFNREKDVIGFSIDVNNLLLDMDTAMSLGLIVNEIVTNSVKHGFKDKNSGLVEIYLDKTDNSLTTIIVKDNGIGFPENFDYENAQSVGIGIIKGLARQIGAKLSTESSKDGLIYSIKLRK